ncbi:MAG: hemin receptor [Acidobacteria bacterium]|nr:hemin receptor [Acidobacteriota bacterium]
MNASQVKLIQLSFKEVAPAAEVAADVFYSRLFELDPSLRHLFRGDMQEQGKKLMQTLALVVTNLRTLDTIVPAVQKLGARHAGYGVRDEHYETVGTALLWTLGKCLGSSFTKETEEAWAAAYSLLANTMKEAAAAHVLTAV